MISHIVPAVFFGAFGLSSVVYATRLYGQWRRDGQIRHGGFGWAMFGGWQPLVSLWSDSGKSAQEREAELRTSRRGPAVFGWITTYALVGVACLAGAYSFARFGHGFS